MFIIGDKYTINHYVNMRDKDNKIIKYISLVHGINIQMLHVILESCNLPWFFQMQNISL